jgi:hypothetical protein
MEVIHIDNETAILIVAIVTATISFTALILKVVEVARNKRRREGGSSNSAPERFEGALQQQHALIR